MNTITEKRDTKKRKVKNTRATQSGSWVAVSSRERDEETKRYHIIPVHLLVCSHWELLSHRCHCRRRHFSSQWYRLFFFLGAHALFHKWCSIQFRALCIVVMVANVVSFRSDHADWKGLKQGNERKIFLTFSSNNQENCRKKNIYKIKTTRQVWLRLKFQAHKTHLQLKCAARFTHVAHSPTYIHNIYVYLHTSYNLHRTF